MHTHQDGIYAKPKHLASIRRSAAFAPYSSPDVDFFGSFEPAKKLGYALRGTVRRPMPDGQNPQTAVVSAVVQARVEIDFLWNFMGPTKDDLDIKALNVE